MAFTCLEQRMAKTYMDMLPKFVPDKSAKVDTTEQEKFYLLIKNLYQLAFNEPLLFVPSLHEDDVYPDRYKKSYGKPELITNMRKFVKAIDSLLQSMYLVSVYKVIACNMALVITRRLYPMTLQNIFCP